MYPTDAFGNPLPNQGGGLFNNLLGGLLGRNADGSTRTLDLGAFIKLPEVTVKADETQKNTILIAIVGLSLAAFFLFKKKWKNGF